MKKYRLLIVNLLLIYISLAQNVDRFGRQKETAMEFPSLKEKRELTGPSAKISTIQPQDLEMIPIEKAINPDDYIVGPGDQFGISINTFENFDFITYVGPAGDILIPTVGVVNVHNLSLKEAIRRIKEFVLNEGYKVAEVYVSLLNVRHFKIQISGAVNDPGFYIVTPLTRLDEIIELASGFHPFAKEFTIEILDDEKVVNTIDYIDYQITGNLANNPNFSEGMRIFVPYGDIEKEGIVIRGSIYNSGYDIIKPNETLGEFINRRAIFIETVDLKSISITRGNQFIEVVPAFLFDTKLQAGDIIDISTEKGVSVNGFVQVPGSYKFFPGYTCADYIGLAGGNSPEGNVNRAVVKHLDGTVERGPEVTICRGDLIIVPRSLSQWFVGNTSIFQITASVFSIILTFIAATSK